MSDWRARPFGATGLTVSALGFGAGHVGGPALTEAEVGRLLHELVDAGVTLFDTARGYGLSEERIGRHLANRRTAIVISTKVGYDVPSHADWTGPAVAGGIADSLRRLRTDYLDIVHLHSCDLETLRRDEVIAALEDAVRAGQVRVAAYSGDNEPLAWAAQSGRFGSLQCSLNICDQRNLASVAAAQRRGMGVIAKRPVANAPWRFATRPLGHYGEEYWLRLRAMDLDPGQLSWQELALRWVAWQPAVHSCIVGTASLAHLRENLEMVARGPLPAAVQAAIAAAFQAHGSAWPALV